MKETIILLFSCLLISQTVCFALLPPKYYEQEIKKSKIKALAIVTDVKIEKWEKGIQHKKVFFKLVKPLSKNAPKSFTGNCLSFKKKNPEDKRLIGGTIYYYPKKGDEVFVAITKNNSYITSYVVLNKELKKELHKNGLQNIKLGPTGLRIKNTD